MSRSADREDGIERWSDTEHPDHIRDDVYDDDCRACSGERNALIAEMNAATNRPDGSN